MNENTRLYTFTNCFLNTISQGIQPLHVLGEMVVKYGHPGNKVLDQYLKIDKTFISLNGGAYLDIVDKYRELQNYTKLSDGTELPIAAFHEDQYTMGGLMTSVGIVVPERLWGAALNEDMEYVYFDKVNNSLLATYYFGTIEHSLIKLIKSCRLAG